MCLKGSLKIFLYGKCVLVLYTAGTGGPFTVFQVRFYHLFPFDSSLPVITFNSTVVEVSISDFIVFHYIT